MRATHEAELNFPTLPSRARRIFIVPELADKTLMSISQLCDAGCQVTFDTNAVNVYYQGEVVLTGSRMTNVALWRMDRPIAAAIKEEHFASAAIHFNTMAEIVRFAHAAMGFPTLSTLDKALANGWLTGIPGLTQATLRKHPPFSDATIKGHMSQKRKNVRSTKKALQICEGESQKPTSQNREKANLGPSMESGVPWTCETGPSHSSETTQIKNREPSMESGVPWTCETGPSQCSEPTQNNNRYPSMESGEPWTGETGPNQRSEVTMDTKRSPSAENSKPLTGTNEQEQMEPNHSSEATPNQRDATEGDGEVPNHCYGS
jgi:hypothetical protein